MISKGRQGGGWNDLGCPELSHSPRPTVKRSPEKCAVEKALGQGKEINGEGEKIALQMTKL